MQLKFLEARPWINCLFWRCQWVCVLAASAQPYGVDEAVMGNYEGHSTTSDGLKYKLSAQIRALENQTYDGFVLFERVQKTVAALKLTSVTDSRPGAVAFAGATIQNPAEAELLPSLEAKFQIMKGKLTGSFSGEFGQGTVEADRVIKQPASVGAKPPAGAAVIFNGRDTGRWENFTWKLTPEGAMQVQKGDLRAKDKFSDFKLHVEFRTPFMPAARGQARGNSGVYLQSKYEVQVLDSFGLFPLQNNDCSSIYSIQTAAVNACLPPMQWQAYDITYRAPKPGRSKTPTITVTLNDVTVVENANVPESSVGRGTTGGDSGDGGFLKLQDHGNPVEYRNIWVLPLAN